jgi:hypothetical protein
VNPAACPHCGARLAPGAASCFLCHAPLAAGEAGPPPVAPPPEPQAAAGRALHLGSLMLVIALIAVCLGAIQQAPGVGVPLAIGSALALARTARVSRRRRRAARPMTAGAAVSTFLASLALITVAGVSAVVAFCVTCFPIGAGLIDRRFGGLGLVPAFLAGFVAAGVVLRLFWKIDLGDGS